MAAKPEDRYLKNEKWVERIRGVFEAMDKNKNGYFTREEWFIVVDRLAKAVPDRPDELAKARKLMEDFCEELGLTGGAKVDQDKYVQLVAVFAVKQMNASMKGEETVYDKLVNAMFDVVDHNHDGTISWEEYKTVTAAGEMISVEAARAGFDMLDKNKNGKIERKEYTDSNVKFWYNLEDTADGLYGD